MNRHHQGHANYQSGLAAEAIAARSYLDQGFSEADSRWRGRAGEIDLVMVRDGTLVFVEVKSSRTHDRAALSLSRRQLARVASAAEEYLTVTGRGLNTDCRIDLALVDGTGRAEVIENITMP